MGTRESEKEGERGAWGNHEQEKCGKRKGRKDIMGSMILHQNGTYKASFVGFIDHGLTPSHMVFCIWWGSTLSSHNFHLMNPIPN